MLTPEDQQATMARLLPFQKQMVEELLADDGLCIMSAGMGWQTVRACCFVAVPTAYCAVHVPPPL